MPLTKALLKEKFVENYTIETKNKGETEWRRCSTRWQGISYRLLECIRRINTWPDVEYRVIFIQKKITEVIVAEGITKQKT